MCGCEDCKKNNLTAWVIAGSVVTAVIILFFIIKK